MTVTRDFRYAARWMRRTPGLTLFAVAALALGIGANTAIFSLVDGVLIRPLPFGDPDRLVTVWRSDGATDPRGPHSAPNFVDLRRETTGAFESLCAAFPWSFNLAGDGAAERVFGSLVSSDFFATLGVAPALGRGFVPEEEGEGRDDVVVIGHGLWQRRFGGAADVLGRTLRLEGETVRVVGVMPEGFAFPREEVELWRPLTLEGADASRDANYLELVGRLRPGVSLERAQAALDAAVAELVRRHPEANATLAARVEPLRERIVGQARPALLVLQAAVVLVLLLACADVATLLLATSVGRRRELAIRSALGADRRRLVRQLLAEGLLLALAGAAVGLAVGAVMLDVLVAAAPPQIPGLDRIALDGRALAVTLVLSLASAVLFSLAPALRASAVPATEVTGDRRATGGPRQGRATAGLVAVQVALAILLLTGAGLLARTFVALRTVDLGLETERILAARVSLPETAYAEPERQAAFVDGVLRELARLPDVEAAGATAFLPLRGSYASRMFTMEGVPTVRGAEPLALTNPATPEYFRALGVPLRAGRGFDERDRPGSLPVAIVSETLARRFWPGESPLGRRLKLGQVDEEGPWLTIVGVVGDLRQVDVRQPPDAQIYTPFQQDPWPYVSFVVRAREGAPVAAELRRVVAALDRDLGLYHVQPLETVVAESLGQPRFLLLLGSALGGLALALAGIGIYGVVAQSTRLREREMGIRVALGARSRSVLALVLRQGLAPVLVGVGLGLAGAAAATRLLQSLLFGVGARDPATFGAVAALLLGIAGLACLGPALRATRVDAVTTLNAE